MVLTAILFYRVPHSKSGICQSVSLSIKSFESFAQMSEFAEAVITFFFKSQGVFGGFVQVPAGYQVWNSP